MRNPSHLIITYNIQALQTSSVHVSNGV